MNPTDLVERLRYYAGLKSIMPTNASACFLEAADALEALQTERDALRGFAQHKFTCPAWKYIYGSWPAGKPEPKCTCGLTTALARDD